MNYICRGELTSRKLNKNQLGKLYSIAPTAIIEWVRKYNLKDLMNTRIKVEIKDEIYLNQTFMNVVHNKRETKNAINLYSEIRLHLSLYFKTPNMVYKLSE